MKIYYGLDCFSCTKKVVLTTGTFDGVHLGHRKILTRLNHVAKQCNGESVLLTFSPHPRQVLFPENTDLKLLCSESEKIKLLEETGINHLIIHPFTLAFSRIKSIDFVKQILVNQLQTHKLVIGYDHHFGRNREGSFEHLKKYSKTYGFEVEEIEAQDINHVNISSTKIRESLINGDIETANIFLGYNYSITGKVTSGNQIGKTLGYATANILVTEKQKLIPSFGVYAVKVLVNNKNYNGMLNIGLRPTIGNQTNETIEVHIFNFNEDIYNKPISVSFISKIRNEKKFDSLEQLKIQLKSDETMAQKILLA